MHGIAFNQLLHVQVETSQGHKASWQQFFMSIMNDLQLTECLNTRTWPAIAHLAHLPGQELPNLGTFRTTWATRTGMDVVWLLQRWLSAWSLLKEIAKGPGPRVA